MFHTEVHVAAMQVVARNNLAAQRSGLVGGVDHGLTEAVRFVNTAASKKQLEQGNIVLLSNVGCATL